LKVIAVGIGEKEIVFEDEDNLLTPYIRSDGLLSIFKGDYGAIGQFKEWKYWRKVK